MDRQRGGWTYKHFVKVFIPVQVALSVDIERPDDSSDEEGVGLTVEDLEELNTISQASTKFLAVSLFPSYFCGSTCSLFCLSFYSQRVLYVGTNKVPQIMISFSGLPEGPHQNFFAPIESCVGPEARAPTDGLPSWLQMTPADRI